MSVETLEVRIEETNNEPSVLYVCRGEVVEKKIPVFNIRNEDQHPSIARIVAAGHAGVGFGVGLYGLVMMIDSPRRYPTKNDGSSFFTSKEGRKPWSKVPVYDKPDNFTHYVDLDKVHPEFRRFLRDREQREALWESGVAFHIVGPTHDDDSYLPPVLVTTPDDLRAAGKPEDQIVPVNTVSFFWWDDPDWSRVINNVRRINPHSYGGISSFNEHKEQPAYTFEDVKQFIVDKQKAPFDFIVRDPIGEGVGVKSSHPQYRVPLVGEPPEWIVVRHGAISIDRWLDAIHSPFKARVLESATIASRSAPHDVDLSDKVFIVRDRVDRNFQQRMFNNNKAAFQVGRLLRTA